jgi:hypothetical protein
MSPTAVTLGPSRSSAASHRKRSAAVSGTASVTCRLVNTRPTAAITVPSTTTRG